MSASTAYPKRLIEVDLPIRRISAQARREKSIHHGHISTLHIWWARRPLAACRAAICAALWPDPADESCPQEFRKRAVETMTRFAREVLGSRKLAESCSETFPRWKTLAESPVPLDPVNPDHQNMLRHLLLDFIAEFANWDNSIQEEFMGASRALTQAAHEALGGLPGTRPLVVDPFAGGGAIPLETLRIGADAFASDLNPVAVLLNKVILEYVPRFGQQLADEVRKWGQWVRKQAEKELAEFYPTRPVGRPHDPPVPQEGWHYPCVFRCGDGGLFIEYCDNPSRRLKQHRAGEVEETRGRGAIDLWHYKVCTSPREALEQILEWESPDGNDRLAERLAETGEVPISYLWARTITCEGPGCGAEVPLMRSPWLSKKGHRSVALRMVPAPQAKRVGFDLLLRARVDGKPAWVRQADPETVVDAPDFEGTVR